MAIDSTNKISIAFKKLLGKAHTQQNFAVSEEGISSLVQLSNKTIFGQSIDPVPVDSGLTSQYDTDNIIEKVRFELDIMPDTQIGTNKSQTYRLKLPTVYTQSGATRATYTGGTYLYKTGGILQVVPPAMGTVRNTGETDFEPTLYQTNGSTQITKFDSINWNLDFYTGLLYVQTPPNGYDVSASRPGYIDAYMYVGKYMDAQIASDLDNYVSGGTLDLSLNRLILQKDTGNVNIDFPNYVTGATLSGKTLVLKTPDSPLNVDLTPLINTHIERLTVTGTNQVSALSFTPFDNDEVNLIINGVMTSSIENPSPFTVTGTTISWNSINAGFDLIQGEDEIIIKYEKLIL